MGETTGNTNLYFLTGGGEMGERIRNFNWSKTPLGKPETWESSLRTCVRIMLTSPQPMFVWWGDALINIYNDAYRDILGGKHPASLGVSGNIIWKEIWDEIWKRGKIVFEKNEGTFDDALLLIMNRHGYDEETYFKFSYNPIPGIKKITAGLFCVCTEETQRIINERALSTLRKLDEIIYTEKSLDIIYQNVADALAINNKDFPFAVVYKMAGDANTFSRVASTVSDTSQQVFPETINFKNPNAITKDFCEAFGENKMVVCEIKDDDLTLPTGAWEIAPKQFIHIPIRPSGSAHPFCIISAALNPYRKFDEKYQQFCQLIVDRVSLEINRIHSLEIKDRVLKDLYAIFDELPFAVAALKGEELNIEFINKYNLKVFQQKKEDVIGKPLFEARPDLKESIEHIYKVVYSTGKRFAANEIPVVITNNDKAETMYFNAIFDPMVDDNGKIVGQLSTSIDVTEQVLARKKVAESETQLQLITDALPVLIAYMDKNRTYRFNNKAYETWFGHSCSEFLGKHMKDVLGEAAYLNLKPKIDEVLSGIPVHFEMNVPYRDGGTRWVSADYIPHIGNDNEVLGYYAVVNDVTAIKKAEALNYQLASIVQSSLDAIISKTLDGIITTWNAGAEKIFGYTSEEMIGAPITRLIPDDRRDEEPCIMKKISEGQMVDHFVTKRLTKEGNLIDISLTISPIKDSEGKIIGASKIARDITEEIKVRKKIEESEQQFNILANNIQNLAWIADSEGRVYWYNQRWYDYTGTTFEEMKGVGWQKVLHPDHVDRIREISKKIWNHNEPFELTFPIRRYDGEYRWFLTRGAPITDESGKIISWIGTNTDIEEQKNFSVRLEEKVKERTVQLNTLNHHLEEKNIDLKKINKELEAFNYITSHDLQEPLRKIRTFSGRIIATEKDKLSETAKVYFSRMQHSATRMQTLIDDLLTFSRISTSERNFELIDHNYIVQEVIEEFRETIDAKKAIITATELCESSLNSFQFRQLLHNLIGNALKFSKPDVPPHIIIKSKIAKGNELHIEKLLPKTKYCHISISDNGIGFEKRFSERIFQVFQRLHGNDEYTGTGIGLAIVKKIVENHNGIIIADSELGKGATFHMYLPV